MSLSQIELVWVKARVEWECFWVNLREDNKVSESNMAEFKIAAIIKLNQNEWVKLFVQNGWILDGRIQDGCHLQVNLIELIWFRVRVEWECFWGNLREDNKVSESKMAVSESNMAELKMAINHQVESGMNEWSLIVHSGGSQSWQVWVSMRGKTKIAESKIAKFKMAEFKIAASIKFRWEWLSLSQIELVWVRWSEYSQSVGMCEWNWEKITKVSESKMAVAQMPGWQNSRWLPWSLC